MISAHFIIFIKCYRNLNEIKLLSITVYLQPPSIFLFFTQGEYSSRSMGCSLLDLKEKEKKKTLHNF